MEESRSLDYPQIFGPGGSLGGPKRGVKVSPSVTVPLIRVERPHVQGVGQRVLSPQQTRDAKINVNLRNVS